MRIAQTEAAAGGRRDQGLVALVAGALLLVVIGLISVPLLARRTPDLAPAATPTGVVQRFYQAAYAGDYSTAYGYLAATTQQELTLGELQQQISYELQSSQMRVVSTTEHAATATVRVVVVHTQPGGIFSSGEWQSEHEVLLQREAERWTIVSGPFMIMGRP